MSHHILLQRARGGSIAQWLANLLLGLAAPGLIPSIPKKNFRGKIIDVGEVNQLRWLEESGQWLENVDRTHLVQASGKPVLLKMICGPQTANVLNLS